MGKMKIGSAGSLEVVQSLAVVTSTVVPVQQVVEIPKPVTKEVVVEIPKPVYKIVEVEEKVQKPKIKVEEVQQVVIKPVFTIKQETIILDQLQRKLSESVEIASNKLQTLNVQSINQTLGNEEVRGEVQSLKAEIKVLKVCVLVSVVSGVVAALASVLG